VIGPLPNLSRSPDGFILAHGGRGLYSDVMRTVAFVLAVIVTALASTDPLCCSDGCARGALAQTNHVQTGSDCPICQPGAVATAPSRLAAGTAIVSAPLSTEQAAIDCFPPTIEHPPRRTA